MELFAKFKVDNTFYKKAGKFGGKDVEACYQFQEMCHRARGEGAEADYELELMKIKAPKSWGNPADLRGLILTVPVKHWKNEGREGYFILPETPRPQVKKA